MARALSMRRRGDQARPPRPAAPCTLKSLAAQLLELAAELRRSSEVDSALRAVTEVAARVTRSYQASLRLLDESGRRLLLSARSGPPLHRRGFGRFVVGEGFIGWVALHREAAMTNRVERDGRFVIRRGQSWMPSGILATPLLARRACIGVLSASRREGAPYRPLELQLLSLVAEISVPRLENARLKRLSESDALTLLHNRRHLDERLPLLIEESRREGHTLSAVMVDLDLFKRVNDTYGHRVGDEVLVEAADRLRQSCRLTDLPARWGGEEFVVVLPDTRRTEARAMAERLRELLAAEPVPTAEGPVSITASLGVAQLGAGEGQTGLLERADEALYRAKRAGRNRVRCA
jgi:diguanylate cyclase (GGDEF)-like protein